VSYPPPPWHTHATATLAAYLVRARDVRLPPSLEAVTVAGRTSGLLAYVEYLPPSPLVYRELIWMPTFVRARTRGGKSARGYYVAAMYVDNPDSLRGGREIWALPKTMATFTVSGDTVAVTAADGTRMQLRREARGPRLPLRSAVATLQVDGDAIVRFRSDFSARARAGRLRVEGFSSSAPAWASFSAARRLPLPAAALDEVASTMQAPRRFPV
jgi:acetoacetate decarboxylase